MADRGGKGVPVMRNHLIAGAIIAVIMGASAIAGATQIKTLGRLNIPPKTPVAVICTDPEVQNVMAQDLRANANSTNTMQTVTVTVTTRVLAPGVSLQNVSPGDPSVAGMLTDLGADAPPIGDTGNKPIDPYEIAARRQATMPEDSTTQAFRSYQAFEQGIGPDSSTPYDNIPQNQIYDTAIVARATVSGSDSELKVVALVRAGDDLRAGKKLVAEEIANQILH